MPVSDNDIYTGLWTNRTQGRILGAALTVRYETGAIVTALLAIFVQLTASYLWQLIDACLHHVRGRRGDYSCDAAHRQHQVILKNVSSPGSVALRTLSLVWCWRSKNGSRRSYVLLPYVLIAILAAVCAASGIIFGIFSSFVVASSDIEVLLRSENCGVFTVPEVIQFQDPLWVAHNKFWMEGLVAGTMYARQCYNTSSSSASACNIFTAPTVEWTTDYLAPCPFDRKMCLGPAMAMDTDLVDSNDVLGLNFPAADRVGVRKITTCSPIRQDGYVTMMNASDKDAFGGIGLSSLAGDQAAVYWYGPVDSFATFSSTWAVDTYANNVTRRYQLNALKYWGRKSEGNEFNPIPELNRSDGDGVLFFFQSGVVPSAEPIEDPMFSAHKRERPFWDTSNTTYFYFADDLATVQGCLEQYQVCIPPWGGPRTCIDPTGIGSVEADAQKGLDLNKIQNATLRALVAEIQTWRNDMSLASNRPSLDLKAEETVALTVQYGLPSNQWQVEVQDWFATVWSALAQRLVLRVVGPADRASQAYIVPPQTPEDLAVCQAQRVRIGQGFSNISLFGLLFVLCLGSVIIATSILLEPIVAILLARLSTTSAEAHKRWLLEDVLHLQRLAYKGQQHLPADGFWVDEGGRVPLFVATPGKRLGPLLDAPTLGRAEQRLSCATASQKTPTTTTAPSLPRVIRPPPSPTHKQLTRHDKYENHSNVGNGRTSTL
ncbi:hypothetical protein B0T25DRAFT_505733 [Lasiosphaeria hispida]|uniref:Uncharacterized protein n=1 Tax=Lasiosphaeria hispida TaxID=260671 RepID=A0AAJ0MD82_9PEZI|nr:hypothetical protein B0T25DRAFT_505733 [Lasiosphaeria hispida]